MEKELKMAERKRNEIEIIGLGIRE